MTYDDIFILIIVPLSWIIFYRAGKCDLLNYIRNRFDDFVEAAANPQAEDAAGLPESAKQELLDSFMKGADK